MDKPKCWVKNVIKKILNLELFGHFMHVINFVCVCVCVFQITSILLKKYLDYGE